MLDVFVVLPCAHRRITLQSIEEIFNCLVQHGCRDLSFVLVDGRYSSLPIENGGFGDVWRVTLDGTTLKGNTVLAVKALRLKTLLDGNTKATKVSVWIPLAHEVAFAHELPVNHSALHAKCTTGPGCSTPTFRNC